MGWDSRLWEEGIDFPARVGLDWDWMWVQWLVGGGTWQPVDDMHPITKWDPQECARV